MKSVGVLGRVRMGTRRRGKRVRMMGLGRWVRTNKGGETMMYNLADL